MTDQPTRQPLTSETALVQTMELLGVNTPSDMLHAVTNMADKLKAYQDTPPPLLIVDAGGNVNIRKDMTINNIMQIIEALKNTPVAGA